MNNICTVNRFERSEGLVDKVLELMQLSWRSSFSEISLLDSGRRSNAAF